MVAFLMNCNHNQSNSRLCKRGFERFKSVTTMGGLPGLEKFSHLEDKIYRTIEVTKKLREERERLDKEMSSIRHQVSSLLEEKGRLEEQVERLLTERDTIRLKIEAMLDAIGVIDPEMAEVMRK